MSKTASALVAKMQSWVGLKKADGSYQKILDIYNGYTPLPRGHKMTSTDAWCAATVSAAAIATGMTDIIPPECSCNQMIALFKAAGEWQEDESVTPEPGWVLFYDWQDDDAGDNAGRADHVGVVEKVENGVITVIEGNYSGAVKRREVKVNGRYIRGYGVPKYEEGKKPVPDELISAHPIITKYTVVKGDTPERIARRFAVSTADLIAANLVKYPKMTKDYICVGWILTIPVAEAVIGGPYLVSVTAKSGLNVREKPSTSAARRGALKYGTKVNVLAFDEAGDWGMILYNDTPGWICLTYVKAV